LNNRSFRYGCWCPSWEDEQPWLQVNFSRMVTISNIKTQGRPDADEWVKSYELHYSSDNAVTFEAHKDVFGNVQVTLVCPYKHTLFKITVVRKTLI
jgi:hypothetical protein